MIIFAETVESVLELIFYKELINRNVIYLQSVGLRGYQHESVEIRDFKFEFVVLLG